MLIRTITLRAFLFLALVLTLTADGLAQVPNILNFQGKVAANGVNFSGSGRFKFALVTPNGASSLWSHDGTSVAGSQPTSFVSLPVTNGHFSVLLGDTTITNMSSISETIFANTDMRLRIWFNDGTNGFQMLAPDQRLASAPYSITSGTASIASTAAKANAINSYAGAPGAASFANVGQMYFDTLDGKVYLSNGTSWQALGAQNPPSYRWAVWNNYDYATGWYFGNETNLLAGIPPDGWSDSSAKASMISSNKLIQGSLFNKKAVITPNSVVWAENYFAPSSTDGKMIGALFRVKNKTGSNINWTLSFYGTAYPAWGELLSVSVNGANTYYNSGISSPSQTYSVSLSIPANRTSTVIVVAGSSQPWAAGGGYTRSAVLAFRNNSLSLPAGLEFVDDLDTATGGYEQ